ncbi:MAG: hypothetical protein LBF09_04195 [Odoribacteraceae bacterium]|jgi:hypothetical protein|nr:hypothetical protein [Odoribacteraceae bacterium]
MKTAGISRIALLLAIILPVFLFSREDTVTGNLSLTSLLSSPGFKSVKVILDVDPC